MSKLEYSEDGQVIRKQEISIAYTKFSDRGCDKAE